MEKKLDKKKAGMALKMSLSKGIDKNIEAMHKKHAGKDFRPKFDTAGRKINY